MKKETKEEFLARYPNKHPRRVLASCECDWEGCTGWVWAWKDDLSVWETEVVK